jgi:hypothetical protein
VLVGDSENLELHAFDFEGNVVHTASTPSVTTALALKPGLFAPLSDASLTTTSVTTSLPITFSAVPHDRFDEPLPALSGSDVSSLIIEATGEIGEGVTRTFPGVTSVSAEGEIAFSVDVPVAGNWTFNILDAFSTGHEEHVGGSP